MSDDPRPPERLSNLPSRLLSLLALHADRQVGERLAVVGARKWHYAVLAVLAASGPLSQADLSRGTGIYRSDMVALINELTGQGLVERVPDVTDRRRNMITITSPGRRRLRRLDKIIGAVQDNLLAPLTTSEREQLIQLLARLADHHAVS